MKKQTRTVAVIAVVVAALTVIGLTSSGGGQDEGTAGLADEAAQADVAAAIDRVLGRSPDGQLAVKESSVPDSGRGSNSAGDMTSSRPATVPGTGSAAPTGQSR